MMAKSSRLTCILLSLIRNYLRFAYRFHPTSQDFKLTRESRESSVKLSIECMKGLRWKDPLLRSVRMITHLQKRDHCSKLMISKDQWIECQAFSHIKRLIMILDWRKGRWRVNLKWWERCFRKNENKIKSNNKEWKNLVVILNSWWRLLNQDS